MGFGGELKDDGVGRRKAAVHRDVHAHCVQVAGETNDVSLLPRALVTLFAIVPLELSGTVDGPRVLVVAHTVARSPAYSLKTSSCKPILWCRIKAEDLDLVVALASQRAAARGPQCTEFTQLELANVRAELDGPGQPAEE
jgi:hypothetical protein